jgi:hypothetical protein
VTRWHISEILSVSKSNITILKSIYAKYGKRKSGSVEESDPE